MARLSKILMSLVGVLSAYQLNLPGFNASLSLNTFLSTCIMRNDLVFTELSSQNHPSTQGVFSYANPWL